MKVAASTGALLERSDELARIESALADARMGRGRFVVVEGPAGIGKTALLTEARTAAAESGMRVLRSRATKMETNFAFGVVRQLFEPPLVEASELERADLLQAAAGVAADLLGLPGAPPDRQSSSGVDPSFAILHGLYWLCANLAAAGPLFLVVDDAHWADAASVRYLAFLLTRLEELDIALVVATRPHEVGTDAELLTRLTTDSSADVIRLAPLTRAAVVQLLEAELGRAPAPDVVDTCLRVTQGRPFLVRELVTALSEQGIGSGVETVGRTVRLRLASAARACRAARASARDPRAERPASSGAACGPRRARGSRCGRSAGDSGHHRARPAADVRASARPRRRLFGAHRLGACARPPPCRRVVREQPGADARVAEHLLVSELAGDQWAVEQLVAAARAARKQGAPDSEAVFLRRALAEPPPPGDRSALLLDLGMAEASAGLAAWPEHLEQAVDTAPGAEAAAEAAMVLAHALSRAHRYAEAVKVLDRASSALDSRSDELALQLDAAAVLPALNDPVTAPSVGLRYETLRERAAGDPAAPPEVLAAVAFISVLSNEPAEIGADFATRALLAEDSGRPGSKGRPWFSFAAWFSQTTFSLLLAERYAEVRPLLDASIAQARITGDGGRLAVGLRDRGWLALRRGDLSAAEGDARTALAATELPAPPIYRLMNGALLNNSLVDQGELDAAEEALGPFDSEAESGLASAWGLRFARARMRVAQGRVAEGLEDFLGLGADLTRAMVSCPNYLPWRSEASLAHLALGDRESAGRLAEEELALAQAFGTSRAIGVAKRAVGIVAGGERGELLLRQAIEALERGDAKLERARASADLGAMLRRRNRRTEARELLREALDAARGAGATPLAEYAETELRATGARPRRVVLSGLDSLTASERRVAEFAGQGLSNREIAQTLFVTARTVEGHLTSVFRKLQVDSRDELPAALAGGSSVPT